MTDARVKLARGAEPSQVVASFLKGFELSPTQQEIKTGHFAAIAKRYLDTAELIVQKYKAENGKFPELMLLEMVVHAWRGDFEEALQLWEQKRIGLQRQPGTCVFCSVCN